MSAPLLARGTDYLLWALLDFIVDDYYPVFDRIEDTIDDLEDRIVSRPEKDTLDQLFSLKRQLVELRHVSSPQREVFNQLTNRVLPFIAPEHVVYFRDIYDHAVHLSDEYDGFRELVSAALDVYLSTVNNNLSLIMKRLTGITVVFAGLGAFAGIFGMSEAGAAFARTEAAGFWIVTASIIALSLLILAHPAADRLDLRGRRPGGAGRCRSAARQADQRGTCTRAATVPATRSPSSSA